MKYTSKIIPIILVIILFTAAKSIAQNDERPLLITIFNQVSMNDVAKFNQIVDSVLTPITKELIDEGLIYNFGQFTHAWGDEWNMNFWYTAKDLASFEKFWNEYTSRIGMKHPGTWEKLTKFILAHKDNIYQIRGQYPVPPQK